MAENIDAYFLRCNQSSQYKGYIGKIENTLEAKQEYVGGLIQAVSLTPEVTVVCNDEGKLKQLPLNRVWVDGSEVLDYFVDNILCVRHTGDEFVSIQPEDIEVIEHSLIPLSAVLKTESHLVFQTYPANSCPAWHE